MTLIIRNNTSYIVIMILLAGECSLLICMVTVSELDCLLVSKAMMIANCEFFLVCDEFEALLMY
jgi:hypothetical protein